MLEIGNQLEKEDCFKAAFAAKTVEMEKTHVDPDVVATAVLKAVKAAKPRPLYRVGSQTHPTTFQR